MSRYETDTIGKKKRRCDCDLFFWKRLKVIDGKFTLRQALSKQLLEKIEQSQIDADLDIPLSHFINTPCTEFYSLYFNQHFISIYSETNIINEIHVCSNDLQQYFHIEARIFDDETTFGLIQYLSINDYETVEIYNIDDDEILLMSTPQILLDNIRILLENGEIADKDCNYCGEKLQNTIVS